ncbi:hypothetical protein G7Y89_g3701 [Cudoniella acicularis]|uniref:NACHT domain-containing protein n=1 Tax=Cudoniella acicularis TaxID=354080 RepID=A0A8H4RSW4_9HELO|nr:hypothetical protein G7Y89_g3701 [Cudoniella acicularis]
MEGLKAKQTYRDQVNNTGDGRVNLINGNGTTYTAENIHIASLNASDRHLAIGNLSRTNPRDDKARIEDDKGPHNQALCNWIFDHLSFNEWRNNQDSRLLWIKGDAGKGKTMLLTGIINDMLTQKKQSEESGDQAVVVTYFFCQRHDERINKATAVLRGLIYLLTEQREDLMKHWKEPPEDVNAIFKLSNILETMLNDIDTKVYLIVDALDECNEAGLEQLLGQILHIASRLKNVRWLVSSRDKILIRSKLRLNDRPGRFQIELNPQTISRAVDIYIDSKLSDLEWLKHNTALRIQVRGKIQEKANATFLWVLLVYLWVSLSYEELEDKDSSSVLQMLDSAPSDLHRMANLTLLKEGYQQYNLFKKYHCKEYQRLDTAIAKYTDAMNAARSSSPVYNTGIIKANIYLADCYRAAAATRGPPDEVLSQRVRLDKAVLSARRVLVEMKQPGAAAAVETLRGECSRTKNELRILKKKYEMFGNKTSASWVDYWLKQLDKAK